MPPVVLLSIIPLILAVMVTAGIYHHLEDEPRRIRRRVKAFFAITRRCPKACPKHAKLLKIGDIALIVAPSECKKCKHP